MILEILKVSPTGAPYPSEFQAYQRDEILGNIATDVFIVSNSISKTLASVSRPIEARLHGFSSYSRRTTERTS